MTLVHELAAGYLIAFIVLLAYLFHQARRLARLAQQLEALERAAPPEQPLEQPLENPAAAARGGVAARAS